MVKFIRLLLAATLFMVLCISESYAQRDFQSAELLTASTEGDRVFLDWNNPLNQGWENYQDFSLSIAPWTQLDIDKCPTLYMKSYSFENQGYVGSAIVWNPSATVPSLADVLFTHSGQKCLAIFQSFTNDVGDTPNNDWIISPKIHLGNSDAFSLWAASVTTSSCPSVKKFNILISTTGNEQTSDFELLTTSPVTTTTQWEEYSFDLSAYANKDVYIAIQCITNDGFALFLDDFSINNSVSRDKNYGKELNGNQIEVDNNRVVNLANMANIKDQLRYFAGTEIYRDGKLINTLMTSEISDYTDIGVSDGDHEYYVKTKYIDPNGISEKSNTVSVTVDNSMAEIQVLVNDNEIENNKLFKFDGFSETGVAKQVEFIIQNLGNSQELNLQNINITGSDYFTIKGNPSGTVAAGEQTTLIVEYKPMTKGTHNAEVVFSTNDANETNYSLLIQGTTGAKWTWMLYLYEDGTGLNGLKDINEWEVLGSVEHDINYIVLYDSDNDAKDGIFYIEKDPEGMNNNMISKKISNHMGVDFDMNKAETLQEFILWAEENYRAEHYGLTVWDHGTGIFRNSDENSLTRGAVGDMKLWEMDDALAAFKQQAGKKIDIFGFDVCLLGQIETAYQLKDYVDYIVFSEKTEPSDGWLYSEAFKNLNADPQIEAEQLATDIVETYYNSYKDNVQLSDVSGTTQSAVSTKTISERLIPALNSFALLMAQNCSVYQQNIVADVRSSWYSDTDKDHRDLGDFLKKVVANSEYSEEIKVSAQNLLDVYNESVIHNRYTGENSEDATGMKVWIPENISVMVNTKYYLGSDYLKFHETYWDEFLKLLEIPVANDQLHLEIGTIDNDLLVGENTMLLNRSVALPFIESFRWELPETGCEFINQTNEHSRIIDVKFNEAGKYTIKLIVNNGGDDMVTSSTVTVTERVFIAPNSLKASVDEKNVTLNWNAPGQEGSFTESFEGDVFPPEGWERYYSTTINGDDFKEPTSEDGMWLPVNETSFGESHPDYIHSGKYAAGISYKAPDFNWLVTPEIEVKDGDNFYYWIWYKNGVSDADNQYYSTNMHLMILADGTWTEELFWNENAESNMYKSEVKIDLKKYEGKAIKVAFVYEYTNGFQMMIDDVSVRNENKRSGNIRGYGTFKEYKVYRNGKFLANVKENTYTDKDLEDGNYSYVVKAKYVVPNGVSESTNEVSVTIDTEKDTEDDQTAIDNNIKDMFMIYPNPTGGLVFIKGEYDFVQIYNLHGRLINTFDKSEQISINTNGVYLMKIYRGNLFSTERVFVNR